MGCGCQEDWATCVAVAGAGETARSGSPRAGTILSPPSDGES